jgi:hypothetical protein
MNLVLPMQIRMLQALLGFFLERSFCEGFEAYL